MDITEQKKKKEPLISPADLRLIAISLSVLSLGLAIAWIGFFLFLAHK